jgi:membrane-associated protein
MLAWLIDLVLHLDRHLVELLTRVDWWIYPILFAVIFCETGLVVTPFLPGDSLLFAAGALAAVDTSGTLKAPLLSVLLAAAAVLGNMANYGIGRAIGPPAFSGRYRLLKVDYLRRTEAFFVRYGGMAVLVSRFMPLFRTLVPFVAGIGRMPYARFFGYNFLGGTLWVIVFVWGGYLFGNIPLVKRNFGVVTILIVAASVIPMGIAFLRRRRAGPASLS